MGLINTVSLTN